MIDCWLDPVECNGPNKSVVASSGFDIRLLRVDIKRLLSASNSKDGTTRDTKIVFFTPCLRGKLLFAGQCQNEGVI